MIYTCGLQNHVDSGQRTMCHPQKLSSGHENLMKYVNAKKFNSVNFLIFYKPLIFYSLFIIDTSMYTFLINCPFTLTCDHFLVPLSVIFYIYNNFVLFHVLTFLICFLILFEQKVFILSINENILWIRK